MSRYDIKKLLQDLEIKFVPVKSLEDNEIYGYKVIKEFHNIKGSKEEIYRWAYEENFFEFFMTKIKDKALKLASQKGYLNKKIFYTLRVNYINDNDFLFSSIESMLEKYSLCKENLCFEIKGFKEWIDIEDILDYAEEGYEFMIKEGSQKVEKKLLTFVEPHMYEVLSYNNKEIIDIVQGYGGKIIYKIKEEEEILEDKLIASGINYFYVK